MLSSRLTICLASLITVTVCSVPFMASWLNSSDDVVSSRLCLPLSGNFDRVRFAYDLQTENRCEIILLTGGFEGKRQSYASGQMQQLLQLGARERDIQINETDIFSTYDEISLLKSILAEESLSATDVLVISDAWHILRTRIVANWIFDNEMPRIAASPESANMLHFLWWRDAATRRHVLIEYAKIPYYYLAYRFNIPWLSEKLQSMQRLNDLENSQ